MRLGQLGFIQVLILWSDDPGRRGDHLRRARPPPGHVQYAKRVVGRRMYGGSSTHIPLKVNTGGVIPVIFASSILAFPLTLKAMFRRARSSAGASTRSTTDAAAQPAVSRRHHLLLLLLHGDHLQSR
jgi:hypothetical protein